MKKQKRMTPEEVKEFDEKQFDRGMTGSDICRALEENNMIVKQTEDACGVPYSRFHNKIRRNPWKRYFATKYPKRFGEKKKRGRSKDDGFLSVAEIPCMEGCGRFYYFTYETSQGLPKGLRKRCSQCANQKSREESGCMALPDSYHKQ